MANTSEELIESSEAVSMLAKCSLYWAGVNDTALCSASFDARVEGSSVARSV